ncbi:MAG: molybdenum ABC transporter substrate-binding protein [Bacteroidetes bacterium 4572_77]|nr:MAG: molybdenum ABC transporter substrate-binding protein [Bacteroidetes bacterium 4572_77]
MKKPIHITLIFIGLFMLINSCNYLKKKAEKKQLLLYCGITMIKPITEIVDIIEKKEDCIIEITKGGSGNLLKSIKTSKIGDLYLPGSENYIKTAFAESLIADTVFVGYNRLAIMVAKGNPLQIPLNLNSLAQKEYYVVIGNPNSGSVGKATKKALQKKGIFESVEQNAIRFTTDSKDLTRAIINKEADIVINWYAPYSWDNNSDYIDIIEIDKEYAQDKKLTLSLLSYSKHPEIAQKVLDFAASKEGKAIFAKYGF